MKKVFLKMMVIIIVIISLISCTSNITKIGDYNNPKKALLVMDMQVDLIDENGKLPIEKSQIDNLLITVNNIIEDFYNEDYLIIYIRNILKKGSIKGSFVKYSTLEETPGAEIDPRINIVSENVFNKYAGSAFSNKDFENYLLKNNINELYLCGVMADGCVYVTALDAHKGNYKVNYISNAVGSLSTKRIENATRKLNKKGVNVIEYWYNS